MSISCTNPAATGPRLPAAPALSAEIFDIPLGHGDHLIYAPLRRAAFVGSSRTVNFIAELAEGRQRSDWDPDGAMLELLRQLELVDAGEEAVPITTFAGEPEPTTVSLFLTTACNLRCTYCYASAGDTPTRFMNVETARRGIDFVAANAKRKGLAGFDVAFHGGGEPSVNWKTMTQAAAYARSLAESLGLQVSLGAATNGVLNDEQIDWMIAHLAGLSLSFDGLPEVQDKHRPTISGAASSARVMHTMARLDAAAFPYGVRVTVTADQIARLPASVQFITSRFQVQRIQVEPAYQLGRWSEAPSAETQEFIDAYRQAQLIARGHGRELSYSAARLDTLTNHFCGITQDNFCLSPDGNVSACYETFSEQNRWAKVFFYGKPAAGSSGYTFDGERLAHLRRQAVQHRPFCQGCFAKWHCAGDCYHKAVSVSGEIEFAGSDRCHVTRELTKMQILDRIEASGGLFWHGAPEDVTTSASAGKELLL